MWNLIATACPFGTLPKAGVRYTECGCTQKNQKGHGILHVAVSMYVRISNPAHLLSSWLRLAGPPPPPPPFHHDILFFFSKLVAGVL
jgi:hypothetical protein